MANHTPKKTKRYRFAHTNQSQSGLGDYYGTGIVAKIGKMRSGLGMQTLIPKELKKPPKTLA
jgi:hypothetical protein